jgi:hypothetical protein
MIWRAFRPDTANPAYAVGMLFTGFDALRVLK